MNSHYISSITNQRLVKQLWISIALASFLPIFVTIYLVSCFNDTTKPSWWHIGTMLGFAILFSILGCYLIFSIWGKLRSAAARALQVASPHLEIQPKDDNEITQIDTAIEQFTHQLRASMGELHQKAAELTTAKRQLEHANEQLQRVDKMKSDFLRFISHEFRSPLMCVRMSLHSLIEEPDQPLAADQEKCVDMALRSSERLLRLINQMIDLTQLRHSRPSQEKQKVEMGHLVHQALHNLKEQFDQKRIIIHSNGSATEALITSDPESLEVAFRHVFNNMMENTPEDGRANICVNATDDHVEVIVEDTGPQIVERTFGDLFEGLVRQYENNDPRWRNDVLGLTLAKEIISLQGGTLAIGSNPEKRGQLIIRLPRRINHECN